MQPNQPPAVRDIVLLGGGHSHVQVIKRFGMQPVPGLRLTLVSEAAYSPYSGMLPGFLAGVYTHEDIHIDLARLCSFAGARFVQANITGVHLEAQTIGIHERPDLRFDVLSINTGATPYQPHPESITVKPIAAFVPKWQALLKDLGDTDQVLVVGGGAGGVEVALALRAAAGPNISITLAGTSLLPGHGDALREWMLSELSRRNILWVSAQAQCNADGAVSVGGHLYPASRALWVTGVQAPQWIRNSGLAVDDEGFICVNEHLQSKSHSNVFAAGDIADLGAQARPKSGVYAVRAGPILAANLARYAQGQRLKPFRAQRAHLALIGCGDQTAVASRGGKLLAGPRIGRLLWWLKDVIDQRFMNNFNRLPSMREVNSAPSQGLTKALRSELPGPDMRCGGCGAKLAADPLRRVLARLPASSNPNVLLGMGDDAACLRTSSGSVLLSVDGFRAMLSDPYVFGRITAHHSLNDLFAMGARPTGALAFVTIPWMADAMMEEDLFQILSGVSSVLEQAGAALVGGHSAEGAELSLALTVVGEPHAQPGGSLPQSPAQTGDDKSCSQRLAGEAADRRSPASETTARDVLHKSGAQVGDLLLLTKPIGTGALLAGAMQGLVSSRDLTVVIDGMDHSNRKAAEILAPSAHALTDVTGFGLLGHLGEMLRASHVGVSLSLAAIPCYPGAEAAITRSPSSIQLANAGALNDFTLNDGLTANDPAVQLLVDPQTSGGLLASVPQEVAQQCLTALLEANYTAAIIGQVQEAGAMHINERSACVDRYGQAEAD